MIALQEVDAELYKFLKKLDDTDLDETVNKNILKEVGPHDSVKL